MSTRESIIWKHIIKGSILVVAWTVLFFLQQYHFAERESRFLDRGQNIVARVVDNQCQNHGAIGYEFFLKGKQYRMMSKHCVSLCESASLGDAVNVIYIRDDPSVSECGSVEDVFNQAQNVSLMSYIFPWLIVCLILVLGVWVHCLMTLDAAQKS
jgi:hypothetical protein